MNKILLGLAIGAIAILILLSKFKCGNDQQPIDHNSLQDQVENLKLKLQADSATYEIEKNNLKKELRKKDSIILVKDARLKNTGGQIMQLSAENKRLKLANDTPGRLHNCDQVYALIDSFAIQLAEKDTALKNKDIDIAAIIQLDAEALEDCNRSNHAAFQLILEYQRKIDSFNASITVPVKKKGKWTVAVRPGLQLGGYYGPDGIFRPGSGIGVNLFPERKK